MASDTSAGTYKIRISKPGCTYFELTGVPMNTSVTSIDLDTLNGGKVSLLVGDANGDGVVDMEDYLAVMNNYGTQDVTDVSAGDVTGNGVVDMEDYLSVMSNYNSHYETLDWNN